MRTRTNGIHLADDGGRIVNKQYRGKRIYRRLGQCSQADAERWLAARQGEIDVEIEQQDRRRSGHVFADGAGRYLTEVKKAGKASADLIAYHIGLVLPYIGTLGLESVHGGTLETFIEDRKEPDEHGEVVKNSTVNRTLEVVRTVLNRAARVWRNDDGTPWIPTAPLIEMLDQSDSRKPYPISWAEQATLFGELAGHLQEMALFAVNTGARDDNVCGLRWAWERYIPELKRGVFVIPPEHYKGGKRAHVLVLNDVASRVVESRRGMHPDFVFAHGRSTDGPTRLDTMNNTGWQGARSRAGLDQVRVHDLRHTYATRLRMAGVSEEDRAVLMGHVTDSMPEHYAAPTVKRLVDLANRVDNTRDQITLLRVVNG